MATGVGEPLCHALPGMTNLRCFELEHLAIIISGSSYFVTDSFNQNDRDETA
jgi:hypothetical protein